MPRTDDVAHRGDRTPSGWDPLAWLLRRHDRTEPRLPFPVGRPEAVPGWHRRFGPALKRALGWSYFQPGPLKPRRLAREQFDDFVREAWRMETVPGLSMLAFVVLPKPLDGPRPGVVCCSGHCQSVNELVGLEIDGSPRQIGTGYQKDFAIQAAREGFVAIAPEVVAWGRRQPAAQLVDHPGANRCNTLSMDLVQLGTTMTAWRAHDAVRMADYLRSRPEVRADRIGITGISGGGNTALFAAAVDRRFRAVVPEGYFCTFRDSIMAIPHCVDNFIPGLSRLAEMPDVAGLVAPRPLLAVTGQKDTIFPIRGVRRAFRRLKAIYRTLDAEDRCALAVHAGPHEWDGSAVWPWFQRFLR